LLKNTRKIRKSFASAAPDSQCEAAPSNFLEGLGSSDGGIVKPPFMRHEAGAGELFVVCAGCIEAHE
jgi:hypothetical protein